MRGTYTSLHTSQLSSEISRPQCCLYYWHVYRWSGEVYTGSHSCGAVFESPLQGQIRALISCCDKTPPNVLNKPWLEQSVNTINALISCWLLQSQGFLNLTAPSSKSLHLLL